MDTFQRPNFYNSVNHQAKKKKKKVLFENMCQDKANINKEVYKVT